MKIRKCGLHGCVSLHHCRTGVIFIFLLSQRRQTFLKWDEELYLSVVRAGEDVTPQKSSKEATASTVYGDWFIPLFPYDRY